MADVDQEHRECEQEPWRRRPPQIDGDELCSTCEHAAAREPGLERRQPRLHGERSPQQTDGKSRRQNGQDVETAAPEIFSRAKALYFCPIRLNHSASSMTSTPCF